MWYARWVSRKPMRHRDILRPPGLALLAVAAALPAGCSGEEPVAAPIAEIAGRPILMAQFEPVLAQGLKGAGGAVSDVVKSRLLDQFLDEQVLLEAARRRGIVASDKEVEHALAGVVDSGETMDERFREELRTTLTVEKLARVVVEEASAVTSEEEEAYFTSHPEEFNRPAVVLVRQILLDDAAQAAEIHASLTEDPSRFVALAEERSISPDQGRRLAYTLDAIPQEAAEVVAALKTGELSPVIERPPHFLIFLMEGGRPSKSLSLKEARLQIRARILERRGSGAMARLLADLRSSLGLRVHQENLPFDYVEEEPA